MKLFKVTNIEFANKYYLCSRKQTKAVFEVSDTIQILILVRRASDVIL
jgi:hypothetical protein